MKYAVNFKCRPHGAIGAFMDTKTIIVEAPDVAAARTKAIPMLHAIGFEPAWSNDWCRVSLVSVIESGI